MSNRRKQKKNNAEVAGILECIVIAVKTSLDKFLLDDNENELNFPSFFSSVERAYIHKKAAALGFKSKSRGKGSDRFLTVYKRTGSTIIQKNEKLLLDQQMQDIMKELLNTYPLTARDRDDLLGNCVEKDRNSQSNHRVMGQLNSSNPQVPNSTYNSELTQFRNNLPVYALRKEIVEGISQNQVVIIVGETGSGKTTQIPQLILEQFQQEGKPCRIFCSQPRRMSAVTVAERVAFERNEKIGQSIGYQIRLESRLSPKTVIMYCTTGVLLRTLMSGENALSAVTHIFVDEVHERDKFSDFLLIALRDNLSKYKDLKIILMSATIDIQLFAKYFANCHIINIPGRLYDVHNYYLEDVLSLLNYKSKAMITVEKKYKSMKKPLTTMAETTTDSTTDEIPEVPEIDPDVQKEMDEFLMECYEDGSLDSFAQILYMYISEGVPIDINHTITGMTGLMAAAHHGLVETVQQILKIGANVLIEDKSGKTAHGYALENDKKECAIFLLSVCEKMDIFTDKVTSAEGPIEEGLNLKLYHLAVTDETIDHDLILEIIKYIHVTQSAGSILVFLPGYDDIVTQKDKILMCNEISSASKYQIFTLHSNMQTSDQKKVFNSLPGIRKIILSTNIAETSITIDSVVFVIDSCKVKQKYFESSAGITSLQCIWTSKACIKQRSGRAGRTQPGKCFILCSKARFNSLPESSVPEILRVPLQELCLHTKLLTTHNTPIADFLAKALEPPSFLAVRNSVSLLKTIGALTPMEDLTEIGHHLLDLAIEPKLGKMLLYACIMKCLDPVLTIVCSLAYKEPFQLPLLPEKRKQSKAARKAFTANALSDHMALLRAFQAWQLAKSNGSDRAFCSKNFICGPTMEMIVRSRSQLLAQLRALGFVRARGPGDIKDVNSNSEKWYVIKAVLVSGLYPSLARVDRDSMTLRTSKEVKVAFHPSSTLRSDNGKSDSQKRISELPSDWLVFEEISRIGRFCFLRCNTLVTPLTVALFAGPLRLPQEAVTHKFNPALSSDSDSEQDEPRIPDIANLMIDDWAIFSASTEEALHIYLFRQRFAALMIRKLNNPQKNCTQLDEAVLNAMVNILACEEKNVGLNQPAGIGQRPRPMPVEFATARTRTEIENIFNPSSGHHTNFMTPNNFYPNSQFFNQRMPPHQQQYPMQNLFAQQPFPQNSARSLTSPSSSNLLLANIEKYADGSETDVKYFMIKLDDPKVVEESQNIGIWSFNYNVHKKILKTVKAGTKAILFFSAIGNNMFVGCATLSPGSLRGEPTVPPNSYTIEWISTQHIPHHVTRHLMNAMNENKKVFASRDGQEISSDCGKKLMTLLMQPLKRQLRNVGNRPLQKQN